MMKQCEDVKRKYERKLSKEEHFLDESLDIRHIGCFLRLIMWGHGPRAHSTLWDFKIRYGAAAPYHYKIGPPLVMVLNNHKT